MQDSCAEYRSIRTALWHVVEQDNCLGKSTKFCPWEGHPAQDRYSPSRKNPAQPHVIDERLIRGTVPEV